jgi:hypothetical protein
MCLPHSFRGPWRRNRVLLRVLLRRDGDLALDFRASGFNMYS